jgi:hypothetical protein
MAAILSALSMPAPGGTGRIRRDRLGVAVTSENVASSWMQIVGHLDRAPVEISSL